MRYTDRSTRRTLLTVCAINRLMSVSMPHYINFVASEFPGMQLHGEKKALRQVAACGPDSDGNSYNPFLFVEYSNKRLQCIIQYLSICYTPDVKYYSLDVISFGQCFFEFFLLPAAFLFFYQWVYQPKLAVRKDLPQTKETFTEAKQAVSAWQLSMGLKRGAVALTQNWAWGIACRQKFFRNLVLKSVYFSAFWPGEDTFTFFSINVQ